MHLCSSHHKWIPPDSQSHTCIVNECLLISTVTYVLWTNTSWFPQSHMYCQWMSPDSHSHSYICHHFFKLKHFDWRMIKSKVDLILFIWWLMMLRIKKIMFLRNVFFIFWELSVQLHAPLFLFGLFSLSLVYCFICIL